jgi:diguanylate cyclase (GGDEF)-like protein/PAS domain S-box-containing protein
MKQLKDILVDGSPEKEVFNSLAQIISEGLYVVDLSRTIVSWNKGAELISGYKSEEVVGKHCYSNILRHVDNSGKELCHGGCPLHATLKDGQVRTNHVFFHHKDGRRVPVSVRVAPLSDPDGKILGAVESFSEYRDETQLQERMRDLERAAMYDHLTGLVNRAFGEKRLKTCLEEYKRYTWPFAVLMIDVDFFKKVNDTYGHNTGDDVLKLVAGTLAANVRPFDTVARWGGEEFHILAVNMTESELRAFAERLRVLVEASSLVIKGETLSVTISVGATMGLPGDTEQSVVDRADRMLYRSKKEGRNRVTVFDGTVDTGE